MLTAKVITVSDRSFRGEREDLSGPAVKNLLEQAGYAVGAVEVLPDEHPRSSVPPTRRSSHSSSPPAAPALHRAM